MSALVLTTAGSSRRSAAISRSCTPDALAAESGAIERLEIRTTRRRSVVGDIFAVTPGDLDDIRFEGGSERFDNHRRRHDGAAASA